MSCTYQSTTLQAGQSFVLPPGATLISASDPGLLTSQNDCAADQIANLETPAQYSARFSGMTGDNSSTENWEEGNFIITGVTIAGVYYAFTSSIQGWQNYTSFQTSIDSTSLAGLITFGVNAFDLDTGNERGWTNRVPFTTIPSIGDNLYFEIFTTIQSQSAAVASGSSTKASVKARPGDGIND